MGGKSTKQRPAIERFSEKYEIDPASGCWIWTGSTRADGYGTFNLNGQSGSAHKAAYELLVGPVPAGLHLHHKCNQPRCVNPAHLQVVTPRNHSWLGTSSAVINRAKTHCPQGHAYDETNTKYSREGWRSCRECYRQQQRQRAAERKAQKALVPPPAFCINGHPLTAKTTRIDSHGHRRCRQCQRAHYAKWYGRVGVAYHREWKRRRAAGGENKKRNARKAAEHERDTSVVARESFGKADIFRPAV